jgi:hypothetical protein
MAIDVTAPRSRRALLAAAIGGLAASAANAIGRPTAALATDGQPIIQGQTNSGTISTVVAVANTTALQGVTDAATGTAYGVRGRSNSTGGAGVVGQVVAATGINYGVRGLASSSFGVGVGGASPYSGVEGISTVGAGKAYGVYGYSVSVEGVGVRGDGLSAASNSIGVYGYGATGVQGKTPVDYKPGVLGISQAWAGGIGVRASAEAADPASRGVLATTLAGTAVHGWVGAGLPVAPTAKTAIFGQCDTDATAHGVTGHSSVGTGVRGRSTTGVGLLGEATYGTALKVAGRAVFSRSGKAIVLSGTSSVVVSGVTLVTASIVLATIQVAAPAGVYVRYVTLSPANSTFTIKLSKAVAADTKVGWFIVN